MQPVAAVQRAYDLLAGLLSGEVPTSRTPVPTRRPVISIDPIVHAAMQDAALVLAWVLEHPIGAPFAQRLAELEHSANVLGYHLTPPTAAPDYFPGLTQVNVDAAGECPACGQTGCLLQIAPADHRSIQLACTTPDCGWSTTAPLGGSQ